MSEKVPFFRSTAFTNLIIAVVLFILCYMVQDIESLSDWSWRDCSCVCMVGIVCSLVRFFCSCVDRMDRGRWCAVDRAPDNPGKRVLGTVIACGLWILFLGIVIVLRPKLRGPRETIDGVTWRYVVEDGKAVIKRKRISCDRPAISVATSGALEIPAKLGGYPVVGVGRDAFRGCRKLTSVTIPESVRYLDWESFKNCRSLRTVVVKGDLHWMGDAFGGCGELKEFVVDPENKYLQSVDGMLLNKAGNRLIAGPGGNVRIPEGVSCIDSFAFARRDGLKSVAIPNSVTNIGALAFSGCKNLAAVAIPKSLTKVSGRPFLDANIRTVYVAKGDVERVKSIAEDLGIRLNSEKTNFGSNEVKFVECDEFPSAIGE